jgi:KaiC/GvpD/RAD55 family RecA-like ATPase
MARKIRVSKKTEKVRRPRLRKSKKQRMSAEIPTQLSKEPTAIRLRDVHYDPKIFIPMHTGTIVDTFFSNKGGIPRATNFIVVGDPGCGKTTIGLDFICNVQRLNPKTKVLFISGEMNKIDMYEYMERYPKFGDIDILFLSDYVDENPKLVVEQMLTQGYDLVLGDSFVEIQDSVKEACFMTSTASERWLIDLMCSHNEGNNKRKAYTTFLMIQQVTKGGKFVGSNKLKHNTTGMIEIRFAGNSTDTTASRYIEFSKNRRGDVNKKLHFSLKQAEHVMYNENKWKLDEQARLRVDNEIEELTKEAAAFDTLLKLTDTKAEEDDKPNVPALPAEELVSDAISIDEDDIVLIEEAEDDDDEDINVA